jgi:hypothetical protein
VLLETCRQLEILHNNDDGKERGSLLWLLDHTRTPFGSRLLRSWVAHPLRDAARIAERLDAVEELADAAGMPWLSQLCCRSEALSHASVHVLAIMSTATGSRRNDLLAHATTASEDADTFCRPHHVVPSAWDTLDLWHRLALLSCIALQGDAVMARRETSFQARHVLKLRCFLMSGL